MGAAVVLMVVVALVVRWRLGHRRRRRSEAQVRQLAHRPLAEFDARFPAERGARRGRRDLRL